MKSDQNEVYD